MPPPARLTDAEHILEGLRLGAVGVWRWEVGTSFIQWTHNLDGVHRLEETAFDGTFASFEKDLHPGDAERVRAAIEQSVATGSPYHVVYRSAQHSATNPMWIEASGGVLEDGNGARVLTGVCLDVTRRVLGEEELARRFRQQKGIESLSSFALGEESLAKILQRTVETAADVFDAPLTKILRFADAADSLVLEAGVGWQPGLVGQARVGVEMESQAGYTLSAGGPIVVQDLATEPRFSGPRLLHAHGVRSGMSTVIAGGEGRPFGVIGVHTTELRTFDQHDVACLVTLAGIVATSARQSAAAEQQRLLMREMAHRSGNLLQVVASLATQTFRTHVDPRVALRSFIDRLHALARANHLITRGAWAPTRFISLLEETIGAFKDRVVLSGRDILLPADLSFDLGLVIHELATNSSKYGSLASDRGTVSFTWHIENDESGIPRLHLVWQDNQPSHGVSAGTGFGSRLKRTIIEKKWNGRISISLDGGYRFACEVPLERTES